MLRGPITLTTDFGIADHFVGTMKGVILSIALRAQIVDITHEISAFNIREGAFAIAQAWRYFPKGSIHVVVVDPGVGSARRAILAEAEGQFFIAPDNGVLSMIPVRKTRAITNTKLFLKNVSNTFHGRDVFAPCAAHLCRGVGPAKFGRQIHDARALEIDANLILKIDRFGNLITNLKEFRTLSIGGHTITKLATTYAETKVGELFAITGSSGYIEISVNQGSAAKLLGVDR